MIACSLPDPDAGVALRLSSFLTCQAQALGENGYQALAGGPMVAGTMTGLVTIFVALIGYRFLLGSIPTMRDGVGWAIRLGMVLTLATGWPAFQVLVYRVAVDAPSEFAAVLLPASGLSAEGLDVRVQQAYDTIRLGSSVNPALGRQATPDRAAGAAQAGTYGAMQRQQQQAPNFGPLGQAALPQTASWFVVSTLGVTGGLRLATGFLLAIGPLAIMALLFDATLGLFIGWVRGLAGAALALLGATIVTALDLLLVESELAHLQAVERGVTIIDPQALTTIVLAFTLVMLAAIWAAGRMSGAFSFSLKRQETLITERSHSSLSERLSSTIPALRNSGQSAAGAAGAPPRAQSVANALAGTMRREQVAAAAGEAGSAGSSSRRQPLGPRVGQDASSLPTALGPSARRSMTRKTRSAMRRDGAA